MATERVGAGFISSQKRRCFDGIRRVGLFAAWLLAGGVGCNPSNAPAVRPASVQVAAEAAPQLRSVAEKAVAGAKSAQGSALIEGGKVGGFEVGQRLNVELLPSNLRASYRTTLYADAQPLEGFVSQDPPVFVVVEGGPYKRFGYDNPGKPVPDTVVDKALRLARAGELRVTMLVVTDPKLRTGAGVGVGSRFGALKAAYPDVETMMLPGMWEEPSCIAEVPTKPPIAFFFKRCRGSEKQLIIEAQEPAIRVVLRRPR